MRSFLQAIGILAIAIAAARPAQVDEYQVKALFLYNFTRYVEWPPENFSSPSDPIVICILGQDPFAGSLEKAVTGKEVGGRPLLVRRISGIQPNCHCHVLFVSAAERMRFRTLFTALRGSSVLTVGESPSFATDGGIINFKLDEGKVRFEINVDSAGEEHLRISSKLLSLAQIVRTCKE